MVCKVSLSLPVTWSTLRLSRVAGRARRKGARREEESQGQRQGTYVDRNCGGKQIPMTLAYSPPYEPVGSLASRFPTSAFLSAWEDGSGGRGRGHEDSTILAAVFRREQRGRRRCQSSVDCCSTTYDCGTGATAAPTKRWSRRGAIEKQRCWNNFRRQSSQRACRRAVVTIFLPSKL